MSVTVGVLALQGGVDRHLEHLGAAGAEAVKVRRPAELARCDGLVIPGGESTTISMLLDRWELRAPISERLAEGMPAFGTCAGMILLASEVEHGRDDQVSFGAIDLTVRRNGYGRQNESFEAELVVETFPQPMPAVFIRAPVVTEFGESVSVLAEFEGRAVLCDNGQVMASSFHPELTSDLRLHEHFVGRCVER